MEKLTHCRNEVDNLNQQLSDQFESNNLCCEDQVKFYQLLTLSLLGLCLFLIFIIICNYCLIRGQIKLLLQIHSLGSQDENITPQKSRDTLVRTIKYQLDRYLKQANADFEIGDIEYDFDYKTTDGQLSHRTNVETMESLNQFNNPIDKEMFKNFHDHYDLNKLAQRLNQEENH